MNRENITKVRDHLATLPAKRFDMEIYVGEAGEDADGELIVGDVLKDCGTAACIAGWTVALLRPIGLVGDVQGDAAELLELGSGYGYEGDELFVPDNRSEITTQQAVRVLDILLETGEVDWERAIREVPAP